MVHADIRNSLLYTYVPPLAAGAAAGLANDTALYPLDTLKTRLQSVKGFQKAGGFKGVYRGLLTVATCSVPTTAVFFVCYETIKKYTLPYVPSQYAPLVYMTAASIGEVSSCIIKAPIEYAKQQKQTYVGSKMRSSFAILVELYKVDGVRKGLYRGFQSMAARDLPYSFIELPVWELLKSITRTHNNGEVNTFQSACCGAIASSVAAAVTTPLDLAKTRIMLAEEYSSTRKLRIRPILASIYLESGLRGLFAGVTPRMASYMLGGFIFFGVYDDTKRTIEQYLEETR